MANINHVITLGIGTPSDIPHFVLIGLSPNDVVVEPIDVLVLSGDTFVQPLECTVDAFRESIVFGDERLIP